MTRDRISNSLFVTACTPLVVVGAILAYFVFAWPLSSVAEVPPRPPVIAHAGGSVAGAHLTNSLEALNANYDRGLRWFELDFLWTRSGELVAFHDWDRTYLRLFDRNDGPPGTAREFSDLKMLGGLTPLTLESLSTWMLEHPDAYVVTDIKENNIAGLEVMRKVMPELLDRLVPQIFRPDEHEAAKSLGFDRIIYSLYRSWINPILILWFVRRADLFAVTIRKTRIGWFNIGQRINRLGTPVYAHTVNDRDEVEALAEQGATGVYSDSLRPADIAAVLATD